MSELRRLTLCADDFALDAAVSAAILDLVRMRRISAVSCLTEAPLWQDTGTELKSLRNNVMLGLHFNLTESFGDDRPSLGRIIAACATRRLRPAEIVTKLTQQIDLFVNVIGELPDYIDGHQHVHSFPVIAGAVNEVARIARPEAPIPIRSLVSCFGDTDAPLKRHVIRCLAAMGDRTARDIPRTALNSGFAGDYSLSGKANFECLLQAWLETAPDRGLIMCHPSRPLGSDDCSARANEFRFLSSPAFTSLLDWHSIRWLRRDEVNAVTQTRTRPILLRQLLPR